jgi:hypothetical protein
MENMVANFNSDQGIVIFESQATDKPPLSLLGPEGTVSVDLFERFLDRQDRKITVMYRGSDLANMSREKDVTGVSAQTQETERLEIAQCRRIADACQQFIDRQVIKYCFGEGVQPLAYFGLPDLDQEDAQSVRDSAGFLADRGALVDRADIADRLGITLTEKESDALQSIGGAGTNPEDAVAKPDGQKTTEPTATNIGRLQHLVETFLASNADPNEARDDHGRWTSSLAPKGQSREATREEQRQSIQAALDAADQGEQKSFSLGRVPESLANRVASQTSGTRNIVGAELRIDSDFVRHARNFHPNLTDADFHRLPEMMHGADQIVPGQTGRKLPAVEFRKRIDNRDHLLVGAALNKQGHFQMTTLKKSAEGRAL